MPGRPFETGQPQGVCKTSFGLLSVVLWAATPVTVMAASDIEILLRGTTFREGEREVLVELRFLNPGEVERSVALPDRIEAWVDNDGRGRTV